MITSDRSIRGRTESDWLPAGGEMGELIRSTDWSRTSLGPRKRWSPTLRTGINLVLETKVPALLLWTPELLLFYNDACLETFADRHPQAFGCPLREAWAEAWDLVEPIALAIMERGEAVCLHDRPFPLERRGRLADAYFDASASPVRGDDGSVAGVFVVFEETTPIHERDRLRKSDARFRMMVESSRDGINLLDLETMTYVFMNPAQVALTGFTAEELNNLSVEEGFERVHPDDLERATEYQRRVAEGSDPGGTPIEYRWKVKSGEYRWFSDTRNLVRDEAGRAVALVGVSRDITERKRVEEALRASEHRYSAIFDASPYGLCLSRMPEGVFAAVNDAFLEMLELERDEVLGKSSVELGLIDLDSRAMIRSELDAYGKVRRWEGVRTTPSGKRLHVSLNLDWITIDRRDYVLTTILDITAEREAEERRAQLERNFIASESRYHALVDAAADGIVTFCERGLVESFNPAAEAMFGYPADEVIGQEFGLLVPAFDGERPYDHLHPTATAAEAHILGVGRELEGVRHDGTRFPLNLSLNVFTMHGRRMFAGFIRDLTEHRELEERYRHSQKMEAIGTLTSGIAHDFGNLLMGIGGIVDIALSKLEPRSPAGPFLRQLRESAARGAQLTRQLMSFSRKQPLDVTRLDLGEVVRGAEELLRRLVGDDISIRVDTKVSGSILADISQIEQILVNLVVNARDAMPEGGEILIRTGVADLGRLTGVDLPEDSHVTLSVSDTGEGMDATTASRAFEPFFTTKAPGLGTGLGLSTVYGITRQLGGRVHLESQPGHGTLFTFYFPRHVEVEASDRRKPSGAVGEEKRVLLVDDDRLVRLTVGHYLETLGYSVVQTGDPLQAVRFAQKPDSGFDLLLTDVVMPEMGGQQLAREVCESCPGIAVLFMSAHPTEELIARGRLTGDDALLQKPFDQAELATAAREALDRAGRRRYAGRAEPM